jgi:predicted extracellular nuclease
VISDFTGQIERNNSKANIAVIGDFNAYVNEMPMKVLESDRLYNLIRELPRQEWYTTNHNGNSQSLDYIFVNKNLRSKLNAFEIPQINSDFMGRLSDHDPVVGIFDF